jgi:hypothetical protein
VTGRICPLYPRLRNSIFTQSLLISNCSNFVRAFSRSIWWWHDACATTAMQARAPARTPPQVSSVVIRDDSRLECLIVFVPSRATTTVLAVLRAKLHLAATVALGSNLALG